MRFKTWFLQSENLAGPGGGMEPKAPSPEQIVAMGNHGGMPTIAPDDNPPLSKKKSPLKRFVKKMKKN